MTCTAPTEGARQLPLFAMDFIQDYAQELRRRASKRTSRARAAPTMRNTGARDGMHLPGATLSEAEPPGSAGIEYFLGAHRPQWLELSTQSLFVSHRTLHGRRTLPRARAPWALDSGGFSELSLYGQWKTTPQAYARAVRRYRDEIGQLVFASQQDWMCEPRVTAKTQRTVAQHQELTIDNYLELVRIAPEVPWMPVVQGWTSYEYSDHIEMWHARGVDLATLPRVGVGSICRRDNPVILHRILSDVRSHGLRIHAFGLKTEGLRRSGGHLASADSMAWSYAARRENRELGWLLQGRKTGLQNSLEFALEWFAERIQPMLDRGFCARLGFLAA
jgi:hypothetical protein